jgi:predicted RecB family nuclease
VIPSGTIPADEFGDMVHGVLQGIPIDRILLEHGRMENKEEVQEAVDRISSQLDRMDIKEIFHEVEVVSTHIDGSPVLGRMDLLVRMGDGSFTIIDFKTGMRKDSHIHQLEIYKLLSSELLPGDISTSVIYSRDQET